MKLNPWPWAVAFAVVLTALLSRACTPDPSPVLNDTRWRDSLRARELNFEVDSAVRVEAAQAATARADSAVREANKSEVRYRRLARWADSVATYTRRVGPVYEPPDSGQVAPDTGTIVPDSGTANTVPLVAYDSLYRAYETADSMNAVLHGAVREYVQAASLYASQAVAAAGRYDWAVHTLGARIETLEGALRRSRPIPRWSAGALWEPGKPVPVGGYVSRDLGRLTVSLQVTDGPHEAATSRLALGARF